MSLSHDKFFRAFACFLALFSVLLVASLLLLSAQRTDAVKELCLRHDEAVASSLLAQGVPRERVAAALTSTAVTPDGEALSAALGVGGPDAEAELGYIAGLRQGGMSSVLAVSLLLLVVLFAGMLFFFLHRRRLYVQAEDIINCYIGGDYSSHLPQSSEGEIYRLFASIEQLATMLQSRNDTEHKAREFLKSTISDISHQLKTPLAALAMYQEIIAAEPDNPETVKTFSLKIDTALKRMEQLIQSLLKITRLDSGSIHFEQSPCPLSELVSLSLRDLTTRAEREGKHLVTGGAPALTLLCDPDWTSEAIANIVKNALDHTSPGAAIHISWELSPGMLRLSIADNGPGIAPEDIHHIFKRFYRSRRSLDTQGVGLGLPLAKAIVEGQGGIISVQSAPGEGTVFTLSFLAEL